VLDFGAGITVNSATARGPAEETVNPNWDGRTDTAVTSKASLGTGETDRYTVTVNATVTPGATADDRDCSAGGGFLNTAHIAIVEAGPLRAAATLRADGSGQDASACSDPASPSINKTALGAAPHPGTESWRVTYTLSVTNPSATASLAYSLTDTPHFPTGVTVKSATVTGAHDSTGTTITGLQNTWNGTNLSIITGKTLAPAVTDTYTVLINTTVPPVQPNLDCRAGQPGHGLLNTGTATSGSEEFTAHACLTIGQTPVRPASTPHTTPLATPPTPASTGVSIAEYLVAALTLSGTGALMLMISTVWRRRRAH
jgi:uncharacterized repeat protein (TIGR01451 family)